MNERFDRLLFELISELQLLEESYDIEYDGEVRSLMTQIILEKCIYNNPEYVIPFKFDHVGRDSYQHLRKVLERYSVNFNALCKEYEIENKQRLSKFQREDVESGGEYYWDFFNEEYERDTEETIKKANSTEEHNISAEEAFRIIENEL